MKLTLQQAKDRFAKTGECNHDPDFFVDILIPKSDTNVTNCKVCQKEFERYYGFRPLSEKILKFLELGSKTRSQIYQRLSDYEKHSIRARLSELRRNEKIFSIEPDLFTLVEKELIVQ